MKIELLQVMAAGAVCAALAGPVHADVLAAGGGRYVMSNPAGSATVLMLDTKTGRAWVWICVDHPLDPKTKEAIMNKCNRNALVPLMYTDSSWQPSSLLPLDK